MDDKISKIAEYVNTEKHIVSLTKGLSEMIPFWICMCLFFMVMVHFLPYESVYLMSRIAIVIMMAAMTYAVSTGIGDNSPVTGIMTVFFCLLFSWDRLSDPAMEMPVWMIAGLLMGSLQDVCHTVKWKSEWIPDGVTSYFVQILPYVLMVVAGSVLLLVGNGLFDVIRVCFTFLAGIMDSFPVVCLIVAGTCISWASGIHGAELIAVVARPFWVYMSLANFSAWSTGSALPFVTSESFYQWFIWIGGSGSTLGLVLDYLLFSKDKSFAKGALKGGIFNINEEVIFGLPIVHNKRMVVPFVGVPIILSAISYFAIAKGMVYAPVAMMPWVLPAPLGALGSCFLDYRAILLVLLNVVISMVVYLPFAKKNK